VRGDRRDRRLQHWSYGARVDAARVRRVLAMLNARWRGRRGKSYHTASLVLTAIIRCWNSVERISRICKSTIAHQLGLHRNTIYRYCRMLERVGLLLQGRYAAPHGYCYKTYSVFAVPELTGQLPLFLTFRRRHSRYSRLAEIFWPTKALAVFEPRPTVLVPEVTGAFSVPSQRSKIVHNTCDKDQFLSHRVRQGKNSTAHRSMIDTRQVHNSAAGHGAGLRRLPPLNHWPLSGGQVVCHEGRASRFSSAQTDRCLSPRESVRERLLAFERTLGHLPSYRPPQGWPRGWMLHRLLAISDRDWAAIMRIVLARPMLNGTIPTHDGRMFQLNVWWLIGAAPRLLAQSLSPPNGRSKKRPLPDRPRRLTARQRDDLISSIDAQNPNLAQALIRLGRSIDDMADD